MRTMQLAGLLAVVLLMAVATPVSAASPAEEKALAKQHFESASRHYDLSEWEAALMEFKEAYRLKPDATFLYNIAQCHRKLGNIEDALTFYRTYLRRAPGAPNRSEVERRMADLEAEKQRKANASPAPGTAVGPAEPATESPSPASLGQPTTPSSPYPSVAEPVESRVDLARPAPEPRESRTGESVLSRWWFWTAVGVAVAGGITLGLLLARDGGSKPFCPDCANSAGVDLP